MTTTPPRTRLRATIATVGGLALAAALVAATPAAAGSPTACRVKNLDTGITRASLQKAHDAARNGHRLTVRGTCVGITTLRKSLTITGVRTKTSGKPILDGKLNGTVVTVRGPHRSTIKVTMKSLTVRNGATPGEGGGIQNFGRLVLRDVIVRGNTAKAGGAVYNVGTLTLNGSSSIRANTAQTRGGGIQNFGTLTLNDSSSVLGNYAPDAGGVDNQGTGTLTMRGSSAIGENSASMGGGVMNFGTLTMRSSSAISRNSAEGSAGGVANFAMLRMRDSARIAHNRAALLGSGYYGGGVWNYSEGHTLDGVRCPMPGVKANVRNNTPDDCYVPLIIQ